MAKYIDIESFGIGEVKREVFNDPAYAAGWNSAIKILLDATAADVAPVVRCKDCKWCHSGYCERFDDLIPFGCSNMDWENWYCADGAKMDKDGDGDV